MQQHKDFIRLRHMLDHAMEALEMVRGKERSELNTNRMLELALVRLVEIIGEAAAHITPELQAQHPSFPWHQVVGMRNRLIHGYDTVDLDILWQTIEVDLPLLIEHLTTMILSIDSAAKI